jgi:hypothetical protein
MGGSYTVAATDWASPSTPGWGLSTLRWFSQAVGSAIVSGLIGGMIIKTWWDLKLIPKWRGLRDRQHLKNLIADGNVLRLRFIMSSQAGNSYAGPIQRHPDLLDTYNAWLRHCDKILAVLSSRWHRRWWLDGSRLVASLSLSTGSVGDCLTALDQDLSILQNCYEEADWPFVSQTTGLYSRLHARWTLLRYRQARRRAPISIMSVEPPQPTPSDSDLR